MRRVAIGSLWLACALAGCERTPDEPGASAPVAAVHTTASPDLGALDARTPVPLLPPMAVHQREQMRGHLVVVQEVVDALARDDLDGVARSASRMGTSDSMTAMCTHMGAGAPGFTERALEMHRHADGIVSAARAGDRSATLSALSLTLGSCTGCHATYRQEIVDHARWAELTGTAAPTH